MARYWVPEYGSAADAQQFEWLVEYSPYHRVVPGTQYPAVFLTAGENDSRVHPVHARKMTAALQAATSSDSVSSKVRSTFRLRRSLCTCPLSPALSI